MSAADRRTKIAHAKNSGGAAGGHIRQAQCKGAAPEQARPKGRANQMKFDIFRKPPASKEKKEVGGSAFRARLRGQQTDRIRANPRFWPEQVLRG